MRLSAKQEGAVFVIADAERFPLSRKLENVNNQISFANSKNGVLPIQVQTNKEEQLKILIDKASRY